MPTKKKKKKGSGLLGRIIRRFFLVLFTVVILAAAALVLVLNLVFNGPSPAARDRLTMTLIEASATKWVPALFIGQDTVDEIRTSSVSDGLEDDVTDISQIVVQANNVITGNTNEWDNYPDGRPHRDPVRRYLHRPHYAHPGSLSGLYGHLHRKVLHLHPRQTSDGGHGGKSGCDCRHQCRRLL